MGVLAEKRKNMEGLSAKGKREALFYRVLTAALFVIASFLMWEFLYALCNMIGSIVSGDPGRALTELIRMMPLVIGIFSVIFLLCFQVNAFRCESAEKRAKLWRRDGICSVILGSVLVLYVMLGVILGEYGSLLEGYRTPLFPLDFLLLGILLAVYGFFANRYGKKLEKDPSRLPTGIRRNPAAGVLGGIGKTVCLMIDLSAFAAIVYGLFILDWRHGGIFYNIMLWLTYFLAFFWAAVYRFVYLEAPAASRKALRLRLGAIALCVNAVDFALYLTSVQLFNEAPNLNAYGLLPIDFSASFNAFMVVMILNNLVAPAVALLSGIGGKGKKK